MKVRVMWREGEHGSCLLLNVGWWEKNGFCILRISTFPIKPQVLSSTILMASQF